MFYSVSEIPNFYQTLSRKNEVRAGSFVAITIIIHIKKIKSLHISCVYPSIKSQIHTLQF